MALAFSQAAQPLDGGKWSCARYRPICIRCAEVNANPDGIDFSAPVFEAMRLSNTFSRANQIAVGRDWMRLHLAATSHSLGFQPISQALQEYPEIADLYGEVHQKLAPDGGTVQMLARLGYGPEVPQSPRWPLEAKSTCHGIIPPIRFSPSSTR